MLIDRFISVERGAYYIASTCTKVETQRLASNVLRPGHRCMVNDITFLFCSVVWVAQ